VSINLTRANGFIFNAPGKNNAPGGKIVAGRGGHDITNSYIDAEDGTIDAKAGNGGIMFTCR